MEARMSPDGRRTNEPTFLDAQGQRRSHNSSTRQHSSTSDEIAITCCSQDPTPSPARILRSDEYPYPTAPDIAAMGVPGNNKFDNCDNSGNGGSCCDHDRVKVKHVPNTMGGFRTRLCRTVCNWAAAKFRPAAAKRGRSKIQARSCLCLVGKRLVSMAVLFAVLAILMIPMYKSDREDMYNFGAMSFDWQTNPRDHLVPFDPSYTDYNVLLDGHTHTTISDGRLTPEQLVDYSIAQGCNAIIVSDHNTVKGGLRAEEYAKSKYADKFVVIPGMEYSNCRIHMNFININTTVTAGNSEFPSDDDIRLAIDRVHELGGLVIVNHIPWSNRTLDRLKAPRLLNHPSIQSLIDWGVDGFEVINQETFDMPTYQHMLALNSTATRRTTGTPAPLIFMTGSDVHKPTSAYSWTVLRARLFTKDAIMEEIANARTSFLFDPAGNRANIVPDYSTLYLALSPLSELAEYFESFYDRYQGQYSFHGSHCQRDIVDFHKLSIVCFVAYFVLGAVIFEIINRLLGYITRRAHNAYSAHNMANTHISDTLK